MGQRLQSKCLDLYNFLALKVHQLWETWNKALSLLMLYCGPSSN